jgi:predicted dienelactone hydrolase
VDRYRAIVAGALALGLLGAPDARALALQLGDPTTRQVRVAFEQSSADWASDLRTAHEAAGPDLAASFSSDGSVANVVLAASALEGELGGLALPGSASDWVLRLDVATGDVLSIAFSFATPDFLAQTGPWSVAVATDSTATVGFLPSFRTCTGPPRCELVAGEELDPASGWLLGVGSARVDGLGSVFWASDVRVQEVPEPAAALLLLLGAIALVGLRRGATPALAAAALLLHVAGTSCEPSDPTGAIVDPSVAIVDPASDGVTLAASATAEIALSPALAGDESLEAELEQGIDAPSGPVVEDRTADLVLAPDGSSASWLVPDLAPGRNRLSVVRRAAGEAVASASRVIDRGGYHGAAGGAFGAGVRYRTWSRPSSLDPAETRTIDVAVWYPTADPSAQPSSPIGIELRAVLDAPPVPGAEALPTVIFSHGNCGWEGQSSYLMSELARAGYQVVAPAHAGNTVLDPDCGQALSQDFADRLDDVALLIDALAAWSADAGDPLAGLLDPDRLGLLGYSAGGFTVIPVAAADARVRALVALATPVTNPGLLPLAIPTLLVAGELDTTAPVSFVETFVYDYLAPPRYLAVLEGAGHSNFANQCQTPFVDCVPGEVDVDTIHARIVALVRGFLGPRLVGDVRGASLLAAGEGVSLTADP